MKPIVILGVLVVFFGFFLFMNGSLFNHQSGILESVSPSATSVVSSGGMKSLSEPISDARSRITKKPFGIYVTPKNSPVQPEQFTGYHTGVDFETTASEASIDIPIYALCDGKVLQKRSATGYGGILVQSCQLDNQPVTVVYGHLRLSSITALVGSELAHGDKIGVLGSGYTAETSGERKHLHLGIHQGTSVNITGYVSSKSQLEQWIDPATYLSK